MRGVYGSPAPVLHRHSRVALRKPQVNVAEPVAEADLQALVSKGQTWQVEKEPHAI